MIRSSFTTPILAFLIGVSLVLAIHLRDQFPFGVTEIILITCIFPAFLTGLFEHPSVPTFWWALFLLLSLNLSAALGYQSNSESLRYAVINTYNICLACMFIKLPCSILHLAMRTFVFISAALAILFITSTIFSLTGSEFLSDLVYKGRRSSGLIGNPNYYALTMFLAFCGALYLATASRMYAAAAAILALAIVASLSRGAILAVAATLLVLFLNKSGKLRIILIALGASAATILALQLLGANNFIYDRLFSSAGASDRLLVAQLLPELVDYGNLLLGQGRANYADVGDGISPHNSFITVFLDGGVIGLILFLSILTLAVNTAARVRKLNSVPLAIIVGSVAILPTNDFHLNREWWLSLALGYVLATELRNSRNATCIWSWRNRRQVTPNKRNVAL